MINPWAILGILVIWLSSLFGTGFWQNQVGHVEERIIWQAKDNTELTAANATILSMETAARNKEHAWNLQQSIIATQSEKEKQDAKIKTDAILASLSTHSMQLRDPGHSASASGSIASGSTGGAGGHNDEAGTELSTTTSGFLISLTGEADDVVRQLTACQQTLISDRDVGLGILK